MDFHCIPTYNWDSRQSAPHFVLKGFHYWKEVELHYLFIIFLSPFLNISNVHICLHLVTSWSLMVKKRAGRIRCAFQDFVSSKRERTETHPPKIYEQSFTETNFDEALLLLIWKAGFSWGFITAKPPHELNLEAS